MKTILFLKNVMKIFIQKINKSKLQIYNLIFLEKLIRISHLIFVIKFMKKF